MSVTLNHDRVVYLRHPVQPHSHHEVIKGIKKYKADLISKIETGNIEEIKAFLKNKKLLRKRGRPYAVFVSTRLNDGTILSGWAACVKADTFSHKQALKIAKGRMLSPHQKDIPIDHIAKAYEKFQIENIAYFDRIKT